ncbi:MAG: hypothetical protein ACYC2H_12650, partial [Thermoplasmatota archaeon]
TARWDGDAMERGIPILQWLPADHAKPFTVLKPVFVAEAEAVVIGDDEPADEPAAKQTEIDVPPLLRVEGMVEPAALREVGKVVQFERFGFVRIESATQGVWLHQ